MSAKIKLFAGINLLVLVADQASKAWVRGNIQLDRGSIELVPGLLKLVHVNNVGAAGGLLGGYEHRMWVFLAFTVVAVAVMLSMLWELEAEERWMSGTLGLIMAGALGNAIDRAHKQAVTDFIRVYTDSPEAAAWLQSTPLGAAGFPSFNVADVAIVVGVLAYLTLYVVGYGPAVGEPEPPPTPS